MTTPVARERPTMSREGEVIEGHMHVHNDGILVLPSSLKKVSNVQIHRLQRSAFQCVKLKAVTSGHSASPRRVSSVKTACPLRRGTAHRTPSQTIMSHDGTKTHSSQADNIDAPPTPPHPTPHIHIHIHMHTKHTHTRITLCYS